jgi:hypothetical protein
MDSRTARRTLASGRARQLTISSHRATVVIEDVYATQIVIWGDTRSGIPQSEGTFVDRHNVVYAMHPWELTESERIFYFYQDTFVRDPVDDEDDDLTLDEEYEEDIVDEEYYEDEHEDEDDAEDELDQGPWPEDG